jgi:peptidoglycan/xylan/chitin deacetylase (PgdA/CDA1 family)
MLFRKLRILSYHNVDQAPTDTKMPGLYVSQFEFARHMWTLRRCGIRGVTLTEGMKHLQEGRPGKVVAITFDDGYADNLRYALPVLDECGFHATCYIVSERLGGYNDWDADFLGVRKPLMSEIEIRAWMAGGMEIGSHSRSHPRLDRMAEQDAIGELTHSRAALSELSGQPIAHFCYPYGAFTDATVSLVRRAGYSTAVTTLPGSLGVGDDRFRIPRIPIGPQTNSPKFIAKLIVGR